MYEIVMYRDRRGHEPVTELILDLRSKAATNKGVRVRLNKINDYVEALAQHGLRLGMPYIRRLEDDIWEIRPTSDRVLFFSPYEGSFVLLHHFIKKTQKTPRKEIEQAKRHQKDFLERSHHHE